MGYAPRKKSWKLFELDTNEFFESRNVVLHENTFPFQDEQAGDNISTAKKISHPLPTDFSDLLVHLEEHSAQPTSFLANLTQERGVLLGLRLLSPIEGD